MIDLEPLKAALRGGLSPLVPYNQWVVWKPTPPWTDDNQTERWAKMLYSPHTGGKASSTNPATWSDYQTAVTYAELTGMGVGFVFSAQDPFFFADVDGCYTADGQPTPRATELCGRLSGAFVEVSVSGTGLHIIGRGTRPDGYRVKAADKTFDIYTSGRFVALTGTSAMGYADREHDAVVHALVTEYMKPSVTAAPEDWTTGPCDEWQGITDDDELISAACRSKSASSTFSGGVSFKDLWTADREQLAAQCPHETRADDFDHNAVDAALCQHLAFWTGKDCERIDRLFRKSALMRDKWERDDYRFGTITGCVAGCRNVYQRAEVPEELREASVAPATPTGSAPPPARYHTIASGQGTYSDGKDAENASTFLQCWYPGDAIRFVQDAPYRFNGKVWESAAPGQIKHELTIAMWHSCPKDATISSAYRILEKFKTSSAEFGNWPGHVVCQNGILNIETQELLPHDPACFTTAILPYAYDPTATAPSWERFMWSTFEGDQQCADLLQEWFGYNLVMDYTHHKAMLLVGAPRSGKGTIGEVLQHLVGQSAFQGLTLDGLVNDATMETAIDKSVLFIGDAHDVSGPDRNRILDRFLSITGNDGLTITRKYISSWTGKLPGRFTIAANSIPTFFDDSGAFGNRLLILPFNKSFLGSEDLGLRNRLLQELPGICNWALRGLERLRRNGKFTIPTVSEDERHDMMRQQQPLVGFIEDECEIVEGHEEFASALHMRYQNWCIRQGLRSNAQSKFSRDIKATMRGRGVKKTPIYKAGKVMQGFKGIRLRPDDSLPQNQGSVSQ